MIKKELSGKALKDLLGAKRVFMRWHNKNNYGGNFGFNIYFSGEFNRKTDRELTGYYNIEGKITSLAYGELYQCGTAIKDLTDLNSLFKEIENMEKVNIAQIEAGVISQ